jgi:hypothetical protein
MALAARMSDQTSSHQKIRQLHGLGFNRVFFLPNCKRRSLVPLRVFGKLKIATVWGSTEFFFQIANATVCMVPYRIFLQITNASAWRNRVFFRRLQTQRPG